MLFRSLAGDHVSDDTGTGFVHTAPGHGREDFEIWTSNARALEARGISSTIPYTVDEDGAFTAQVPGFTETSPLMSTISCSIVSGSPERMRANSL